MNDEKYIWHCSKCSFHWEMSMPWNQSYPWVCQKCHEKERSYYVNKKHPDEVTLNTQPKKLLKEIEADNE